MAQRNRYGYNCQTVQWAKVQQFVPLGYVDCVPGETVSGSVSVNVFSEPTTRPILNRHYIDAFAFYVPYRLLDESFPDFISGRDASAAPPFVTNTFDWNFEKVATIDDTVDKNTAWLRRCYTTVYNKFFNPSDTDVGIESTSRQTVAMRPSTLETSFVFEQEAATAETFSANMDSLREAAWIVTGKQNLL